MFQLIKAGILGFVSLLASNSLFNINNAYKQSDSNIKYPITLINECYHKTTDNKDSFWNK